MRKQFAIKVGRLNGRNVYRVPVTIRHNSSRHCCTLAERQVVVLAYSAADAANWVRDNEAEFLPETEIVAVGPKGGETLRYIGWETYIGAAITDRYNAARQRTLQLEVAP